MATFMSNETINTYLYKRRERLLQRTLKVFELPKEYNSPKHDRSLVSVHDLYAGTPLVKRLPHRFYVTEVRLEAEEIYIFNLPQHYTEITGVIVPQVLSWNPTGRTRDVLATFSTFKRRFDIPSDSALLKLAIQYRVTPPRTLDRVKPRQMRSFMEQLQTVMYDGLRQAIATLDNNCTHATDFDTFFTLSLLAHARGGSLTFERFLKLHTAAVNEKGSDSDWAFAFMTDSARACIALNNPELLESDAFAEFMEMPMNLLAEVYA